jgi:hypothetical protein
MSKEHQAELILKLYELRRDPELRKARAWYVGEFNPQSGQDIVDLLFSGPKSSAHYRMVTSYWDMAAAMVLHGAIDATMFLDTNGEIIMLYAKIQPFLAEVRQLINRPDYLKNVDALIQQLPNADSLLEGRRRLAAIWLKAGQTA